MVNRILERDIENLLEQQLSNNDWIVNFQNVNKQVFYQTARTDEEKQKL
jgi:hypothetical protein